LNVLVLAEGNLRVGRPAIRLLDSDEEDLKTAGVRNWGRKSTESKPLESNRKRGQGSS
jgi:hypothetical protein